MRKITELVSKSESEFPYRENAEVTSDGRTVFVISDLHLASGINSSRNYEGTENFFADQSLVRFLEHLQRKTGVKKSMLVINGDIIDFLRITNIPKQESDMVEWQQMLSDLGIEKTNDELRKCIVKRELEFGLKTDDYKSVWKLGVCAGGHHDLFARLAKWIHDGNKLIIIKGNHDLEWFWKPVRDALRLIFAKHISEIRPCEVETAFSESVVPNLLFADDSLLIDKKIYFEHGHRYEKVCWPDGPPVLNSGHELNLPFGSFFNRYFLNRIELAYPYLDNVRPSRNILPLLIRERFPLAMLVLFKYFPLTFRLIPKRQYHFVFRQLYHFLLLVVIPVGITAYAIYKSVHFSAPASADSWIVQQVLPVLKNFAFLSLSYFLGRLLVKLELASPGSLSGNAQDIFTKHPGVQLVTFGHTHDPEQHVENGRWYYNTGTWMPVFELDSADVRLDKTYTFLQIDQHDNALQSDLMRWNDDGMREERMVLVDKS